MKKILNKSKAGKGAQEFLKKKLSQETKKFDKETASLKKEEADLISQKKIITPLVILIYQHGNLLIMTIIILMTY